MPFIYLMSAEKAGLLNLGNWHIHHYLHKRARTVAKQSKGCATCLNTFWGISILHMQFDPDGVVCL
jgi:hypothetical protein